MVTLSVNVTVFCHKRNKKISRDLSPKEISLESRKCDNLKVLTKIDIFIQSVTSCISSNFSLKDHKMFYYECSGNLNYCFCLICKKEGKSPFFGCYLDCFHYPWYYMNLYYNLWFCFCKLIVIRKLSLFHVVRYFILSLLWYDLRGKGIEKLIGDWPGQGTAVGR